MSETREFSIGAVLTITDGKLLTTIDEVYGILNWMTGESLMTHQLPRASRECEANLRAQHPGLGAVVVPPGQITDEVTAEAFLAPLRLIYGATVPVAPLPEGQHTHIHPLEELRMMRPDMPVIVIQAEPREGKS